MKQKIGIVGIGMMGHGIASNILKHGYTLAGLEHAGNQPLDDLLAAGLTTHASARELAAASDVVILCVTGTPQVEAILLGEGGVLEGLRPGAVVVDCSTAIPISTVKLAEAVARRGGRFMDAAMTRTPKEAAEGRLNLLVGADEVLFAECRPILACFAENITLVGPVGSGHRMKLLHNYVSLGCVALIAEAAACSARAGVAPEIFAEVLTKGGGGGIALERLKPYLIAGDATGLRFSLANAFKDIGYYATMASDADSAHAIADGVLSTLEKATEKAVQQGSKDALMPELVTLLGS